jgi:DNA helicase HerA-like ATPase
VALMKQARAFGVGVMVSTQDPMDLDYRALGNAGLDLPVSTVGTRLMRAKQLLRMALELLRCQRLDSSSPRLRGLRWCSRRNA